MAQFDVYPNPADVEDDELPYVLDVQSDLLAHLNVRIVVPLVRANVVDPPLPGLNPRFLVEDRAVVMATTLIGGLPVRALREPITNFADHRHEIVGAIGMLITGI
ncbi:MAG: CcdB family protein [Geminicoccaceae bacterium]